MLRIVQPPFLTIQGEGPQAGTPSVFLRLSGCHIHCPWCIGIKAGWNIPKIWTRGKNIPINEIKLGDKVLAVNENNEITETIVKKVFSREVSEWYEIKIEEKPLFVTPEHPFLTKDGWIMVKDLKVGDELLTIDFKKATIPIWLEKSSGLVEIKKETGFLKVYNFECTPYKNYIVNGIISHNCDTKISWGKGTPVDIPELVELVKKEIYYSTPPGIIKWLTVTGGEPMLQQKELGKFIRRVVDETGLRVAIETSGSVPASIEWQSLNWDFIHRYQISPKKRGGIDALVTYPDVLSVLKFVLVEENSLLDLIEEVLERTNFKREQIWILPLSSSLKELTVNAERARKFCLKYGFKLSPRLQYFWRE